MFKIGASYCVISERGVRTVVIKATTDTINLLTRLSEIARVQEVSPLVTFHYH